MPPLVVTQGGPNVPGVHVGVASLWIGILACRRSCSLAAHVALVVASWSLLAFRRSCSLVALALCACALAFAFAMGARCA